MAIRHVSRAPVQIDPLRACLVPPNLTTQLCLRQETPPFTMRQRSQFHGRVEATSARDFLATASQHYENWQNSSGMCCCLDLRAGLCRATTASHFLSRHLVWKPTRDARYGKDAPRFFWGSSICASLRPLGSQQAVSLCELKTSRQSAGSK